MSAPLSRNPRGMAAPPCALLGDGVTDDVLLHIATFLTTAKDLLRLQLTHERFASECIAAPSGRVGGPVAAPEEMLCLAEEAARRWVAGCSEQERGWVPRRGLESWLGLMHGVELLRLPLAFDRAHALVTLSENGAVATGGDDNDGWESVLRTAANTVVMRSGRHFAQFTVLAVGADELMFFAALRPEYAEGGGLANGWVHAQDGHCFYRTDTGHCYPAYSGYDPDPGYDWEGVQTAKQGDRIGMLLDLDQGSMTVWKNGQRLGVMKAEGRTGPLCWAARVGSRGDSARIESAPAPPSPTEAELAAAKAWELAAAQAWDRRNGLDLPVTATDAECEYAEAQ